MSAENSIAPALNALLAMVRWVDGDQIVHLDNNVHLARAISQLRGQETSQSYVQAIRQGHSTDPRWSVVCAICEVLTERSGVRISPDYFYDTAERTRVNELLDARLDLLKEQLRRS